MIGGTDRILAMPARLCNPTQVLLACLKHWPNGYYQHADEGPAVPIREALTSRTAPLGDEFFVYKDRASADSWERDGATPENQNTMIHFLIGGGNTNGPDRRLTMVIGDATPEMEDIEQSLRDQSLLTAFGEVQKG
jgi:hypothetical protein